MSEIAPSHNLETESLIAEAYYRVAFLTSDIVFDQAEEGLSRQLTEDPVVVRYAELESTQSQATHDMYDELRNGNQDASNQYLAKVQELAGLKDELPRDVARKYNNIRGRLDSISKPYQAMRVTADSFEGNVIRRIISEAPKPQNANAEKAPAKYYAKNNEESWTHMPDEVVREYLEARTFFDTYQARRNAEDTRSLVIDTDPETPLEIPLDLIVDATGFDSWLGREGYGSGKNVSGQYQEQYDNQIPSLDVIKHYASLPSELPPVGTINLYIQPNGVIFGDNNSGDSHRIAAAILRGDTTIKADHVSIRCLDRNYLEASLQ